MAKKILIVEDDEPILTLLSEIFGCTTDYIIICAQNGEEALRIVRSDHPDLILLDVQIPGISGHEVCKEVKSDTATARTKILVVSGMVQKCDERKALQAGADGFITKPFRSAILMEKVEELLTG